MSFLSADTEVVELPIEHFVLELAQEICRFREFKAILVALNVSLFLNKLIKRF